MHESLVAKYRFDAPSYACYPAPECFGTRVLPWELAGAFARRRHASRPLALSVHLAGVPPERLRAESQLQQALCAARAPLARLEVRGASAEALRDAGFAALLHHLRERFSFAGAHCVLEIDAAQLTAQAAAEAVALDLPRLRVACASDADERALARALDSAARAGPFEAALAYGRAPHTPDAVDELVGTALRARPARLLLYARHDGERQDRAAMLVRALERLAAAGYTYAGFDAFVAGRTGALPQRCDRLGIGLAALSMVDDCCAQNALVAADYARPMARGELPLARGHWLSADDCLRRDVIHALECGAALAFSALESKYGIVFARYFAAELRELERMQEDGLVELYEDALELTPAGRPLARLASALFDRYLPARRVAESGNARESFPAAGNAAASGPVKARSR